MRRNVRILSLYIFLFFLIQQSFAQQNDRVYLFETKSLSLIPPPGFTLDNNFIMSHATAFSIIAHGDLLGSRYLNSKLYDEDSLKRNPNDIFVSKELVQVNGKEAVLAAYITKRGIHNSFNQVLLIWDTDSIKGMRIVASCMDSDVDMKQQLRKCLLSVEYNTNPSHYYKHLGVSIHTAGTPFYQIFARKLEYATSLLWTDAYVGIQFKRPVPLAQLQGYAASALMYYTDKSVKKNSYTIVTDKAITVDGQPGYLQVADVEEHNGIYRTYLLVIAPEYPGKEKRSIYITGRLKKELLPLLQSHLENILASVKINPNQAKGGVISR